MRLNEVGCLLFAPQMISIIDTPLSLVFASIAYNIANLHFQHSTHRHNCVHQANNTREKSYKTHDKYPIENFR